MDCTEKYALWGRRRRDESSWQPPSRIFLLINVCPIGVNLTYVTVSQKARVSPSTPHVVISMLK